MECIPCGMPKKALKSKCKYNAYYLKKARKINNSTEIRQLSPCKLSFINMFLAFITI